MGRNVGHSEPARKRIEVNEMSMLRWMCVVTRTYKIRNKHIRGEQRVAQVFNMIAERRLNWYGQVMRRDEEHILSKVLRVDIKGKRKRERPKRRWTMSGEETGPATGSSHAGDPI